MKRKLKVKLLALSTITKLMSLPSLNAFLMLCAQIKSSELPSLSIFQIDIKPATFNLRRVYLKAFFDFLVRENIIEKNPIDFKKRKDEGRARAIPIEILKELLSAPDKKSYAGFRDYCLILFMLDTGIRPGEALKLKKEDFNLASFEVTILSVKTC
ncbi:MAG TPA: hypothetical protein HA302_03765 [Thermococcaceae archaeon]|nr:hypothetical protein [Thermococcaceae archaeon]